MSNPWHRMPARLRSTLKIILIVGIVGFVLDLSIVIGFSIMHPTIPNKVDAVIVLGAKVGTPALTNRTLTGLKFYQEGKTNTLVLSGARGSNEPMSEARAMENVIKEQVAKTHGKMPKIILETKSTDTFQNLSNSKALIPNAKSVIIVSDCYHLERSVTIAKHVGFKRVYWDSPKPSYYSNLDLAHYYVREAVAMVVYLPKLL